MIFRSPTLTSSEAAVLGRIVDLNRTLSVGLTGAGRWRGQLRRVAFAKALRGSNTIEGYNVTVDDAIAAVDGEEPLDAETETWRAVKGYQAAMTYVRSLADDPYFRFSEGMIQSLHFMMLEYDLSKYPGRWRPREASVINEATGNLEYTPPPHEEVPDLVGELVGSLNSDGEDHGIIRAAMAHLNLTMIHPFLDGNGRMGRCLQSLVLARTGFLAPPFCSIEEYLGRNTSDYYGVLASVGQGKWNPRRDTREWIRFCLVAHYRQAATQLRRYRKLNYVWTKIEEEIAKWNLPDRMIYALADAALGYRVRNGLYRRQNEISSNLASRDLRVLVDRSLLVAHGEKRGRYYVASPRIRSFGLIKDETKMVPNPFDDESREPMLPGFDP